MPIGTATDCHPVAATPANKKAAFLRLVWCPGEASRARFAMPCYCSASPGNAGWTGIAGGELFPELSD